MRFASTLSLVAALACALLSGCGGSSSETTITGSNAVTLDAPTGPNTTEVVVDAGPASSFALGAANIPYVTVTVCAPGSSTQCATVDHVFLDTGSIGLRVLRSAVASLNLPALQVPADVAHNTPAGAAVQCYPFVLGAVWGPLATADVRIAQETAATIPVQLIDDLTPPTYAVPPDCTAAAQPGELMNSAASLQAKGILGVGMLGYDCGHGCAIGDYSSGHVIYYSCAGTGCAAAALPSSLQTQNPVVHFPVDNNGTLIVLPALPESGASVAKGRLVFGIGTQTNNQIPASAKMLFVDANPASATYLSLSTTVGATSFPDSYIDSGSNALFFDDGSIAHTCQSSAGSQSGWYCPSSTLQRSAVMSDGSGTQAAVNFSVANADTLFGTSNTAFADLAGTTGTNSSAFAWGLSFFYGRAVFTSIWGQALSLNGPWNAF
jgi:hypothetical protein